MIRLEHTSGSAVAAAIADERRRLGSPATGMVLTLLILSDEESASDATEAAVGAARMHPMRILTLIPKPGKFEPRLDAQVSVGGDMGPGEVAELRLRGELASFPNSVAVPLLLPDTPVVAFWPSNAPDVPADDLIGRHAQRRITDSNSAEDSWTELIRRRDGYRPGDTDLSWSRITSWRSVLASALDQEHAKITSASVVAQPGKASPYLLRQWIADCLEVDVHLDFNAGPGINQVHLHTHEGDISVTRPDGMIGILSRPGVPDAHVSLPRRDYASLLAEELRRLDPDVVYARTLANLGS